MRQTDSALRFVAVLGAALALRGPADPTLAEKRETPAKAKVAQARSEVAGRKVFESRCAACHGLNGRGGEYAPDIVSRADVAAVSDQALFQIIRDGIPRRGMPGFRLSLTPAQMREVVAFIRNAAQSDGQAGAEKQGAMTGNPERGAVLFFGRAGCGDCHMVGGKGGFLGPDLSRYGRDHWPRAIRDAIVNPNRNVLPARQAVVATTRDGREFIGMARNEDNFSVQLLDRDGNFHLLMKSDLADLKREPKSLMPGDYATRLSGGELQDLVSYLATRR